MILPIGVSVSEWCDLSTPDLERFGTIPVLLDSTEWQEWARSVIALPEIAKIQPPLPDQYLQWDLWADRFIQTFQAANLS